MAKIRAILLTTPRMMADMVLRALADGIEIETVAEMRSRDGITNRLRALHPDLVLIGLRDGEDDSVGRAILDVLPRAMIIAFSSDLHQAFVHTMEPHRTKLLGFSREDLLAQIGRFKNRA